LPYVIHLLCFHSQMFANENDKTSFVKSQ